jgi:hypothetical protein
MKKLINGKLVYHQVTEILVTMENTKKKLILKIFKNMKNIMIYMRINIMINTIIYMKINMKIKRRIIFHIHIKKFHHIKKIKMKKIMKIILKMINI